MADKPTEVTADNLTDEQIATAPVEAIIRKIARHVSASPWLAESTRQARQRCADAINARAKAVR